MEQSKPTGSGFSASAPSGSWTVLTGRTKPPCRPVNHNRLKRHACATLRPTRARVAHPNKRKAHCCEVLWPRKKVCRWCPEEIGRLRTGAQQQGCEHGVTD